MHTLVLDIGGIFFRPAWRAQGIDEVSQKLAVQKDQLQSALKQNKDDFYEGRMLECDYWQFVLDRLGTRTYTPDTMAKIYRAYITPVTEMLALLPKLADKNILISCNNSSQEWMDERVRLANLDRYFSKFFTSGYVHFQKPSLDMYAQVFHYATSFGYPITYIDDNETYVRTVQKAYPDIATEVYKNPDTLLRWIR